MPDGERLADRIRQHVRLRIVDPARQTGVEKVTIRAGDVVRELGVKDRSPAVCSALASKKFLDQAGLRLLERHGPHESTTTEFCYEILDPPPLDL